VIKLESQPRLVVIYEGTGSSILEDDLRYGLMRELLEKGYKVTRARQGGERGSWPGGAGRILVLAAFHAGAPNLEDRTGAVELEARDIQGRALGDVVSLVEAWSQSGPPMNQPPQAGGLGSSWKPWFPVIDYDRCTNCMQCLSFCLFDVYGVSEDNKIQVQNNDNCKTNCPACSRVCPEVAIMFPKYFFNLRQKSG
jgi:NAD-dependent dihydropyrimidine dehydrogenase PreA subunit